MAKKCGICEYSRWDKEQKEYICQNEESENYGFATDYNECCIEFVERD